MTLKFLEMAYPWHRNLQCLNLFSFSNFLGPFPFGVEVPKRHKYAFNMSICLSVSLIAWHDVFQAWVKILHNVRTAAYFSHFMFLKFVIELILVLS